MSKLNEISNTRTIKQITILLSINFIYGQMPPIYCDHFQTLCWSVLCRSDTPLLNIIGLCLYVITIHYFTLSSLTTHLILSTITYINHE